MRKVIITVAPVAGCQVEGVRNPLRPEEIAEEVVACAQNGASIVHLHVRDKEGKPTSDLTVFSHTIDMIKARTDIIIQGSTGGVSKLSEEERCVALNDPRVEMASLNMGSINIDDNVYINTMPEIRYWASRMHERNILPEMMIFGVGMFHSFNILAQERLIVPPFVFSFPLGFRGAPPADPDSLFFLLRFLPPGSIWGVNHQNKQDISLLAVAIGMGASFVRIGFEDSLYLNSERMASSNVELVEQAANMIRVMGFEVATTEEARAILGLSSIA